MKAKPTCPHCHGKGVLLDPDPRIPARPCKCTAEQTHKAAMGIPSKYREATMEGFWEWWKRGHPDEKTLGELDQARELMENEAALGTIPMELQNKLAVILGKCSSRDESDRAWKSVRAAQEPNGFGALKTWILKDYKSIAVCWVDGAPGSGRSSLAAAALSAWCGKTRQGGLFVSVRAFSQELKDTYYDVRGWQNTDFLSERDRMAPLLAAPCLVLDDFDRVDSDVRVLRAMAQLLDHRWGEDLPTIVTAARWAETLEADREAYPFTKLEDASTLNRLAKARRVELIPTLSRLMRSL